MSETRLYKMYVIVDDWLSSQAISQMSSSAEGCYFRLLLQAWKSDDCGLPTNPKKLRRLANADESVTDEDWQDVLDQFFEKNGKLYNEKQLKVWQDSINIYDKNVANGKKGGRPKKPKNNPEVSERNPNHNPNVTQTITQTESNTGSRIQDLGSKELLTASTAHEESLGSVLGCNPLYFSGGDTLERIEKILGPDNWEKSGHWFKYAYESVKGDVIDVVQYIEDASDPAIREKKGIGEFANAGGYLRKKLVDLMKARSIPVLTENQVRQRGVV